MCWTGFKQNHKMADEDVKVIKVLYRKINKGEK